MNTFSFDFNNGRRTTGNTESNTGSYAGANTFAVRRPTPNQINYYMDLCVQRRVNPKNITAYTFDQLRDEIDALRKFYPASENQIQMIKDKITGLQDMGVMINMLSSDEFNALTGGRTGTASALIESLIKLERDNADNAPPTDKQLEFLVSMYLCPDVNFEERFEISRKIDLGEGLWRRPTPDEFAEQIKNKMKRRDASKFIDDFRGVFHTWKQSRIRPEQQRYIRQLEERMSNLGSPKVIEYSIDQYGNIQQIEKHVQDKSSNYSPKGYIPLDEMQLMMFSTDEASKYIDILKSEMNRKELYSYSESSDNSMTFEDIRTAKDENEQKVKDFEALQDLIFKLEAVAGYENQEVHDAVNFYLVEEGGSQEAVLESKKIIKDFMLYLINEEYISMENIVELCKDSKTAQRILIG